MSQLTLERTSAVATPAPRPRIGGVDAARALAIVGMVMVHFGPIRPTVLEGLGRVYALSYGRASILFVLLAGVGVSLLAVDRSRTRRRRTWAHLAFRAAVLLPLGLALQLLDHNVLVILQYYAVYFLVAALALRLSNRGLCAVASGAAVVGPLVYLAAWHWRPGWFTDSAVTLLDHPAVMARDLLLSGAYPVVTWSGPLLFGMWLGRLDLRSPTVRLRMVLGGGLVATAAWAASRALLLVIGEPAAEPSWAQLVLHEGHSDMPLWLASATDTATAVLGLVLEVVDRLPRVTWPLVALGQLALTVYVAQLVALALWPEWLQREDVVGALVSVARFTVVAMLVCVAWRAAFPRGPLEALSRLPRALEPHSPRRARGQRSDAGRETPARSGVRRG